MEPASILPAYMAELKAQNNIRVLVHHDRRIVCQIDCVGGTGTVEVLPLFSGMVLQFLSFRCKSFHPSEIKEMGDCLKINYWELLYKGWFTLPTTLHRLTVHLWQSGTSRGKGVIYSMGHGTLGGAMPHFSVPNKWRLKPKCIVLIIKQN